MSSGSIGQGVIGGLEGPSIQFVPLVLFEWDEQKEIYLKSDPLPIGAEATHRAEAVANPTFSSTKGYCRYDSPITIGGRTWSPLPETEIDMGTALHAGVDSNPVKIRLPIDTEPVNYMSSRKFAPVKVSIYEHRIDGSNDIRHVFSGKITKVTSRSSGQSLISEIEIHGIKKEFESVPSGIRLTQMCGWIYGDCNCNSADRNDRVFAKIQTIDGVQLGLSGLGSQGLPQYRYTRGWVSKVLTHDGVGGEAPTNPTSVSSHKIPIVYAVSGVVILADAPMHYRDGGLDDPDLGELHAYRNGDYVIVAPGCDKSIASCDTGHDNTRNWGGFGTYMQSYNPIIESPT